MGAMWDMLRAFFDALLAVGSFVGFYHAGIAFYRRFLCRESEPRYTSVRHLFATTFALSFSIYFLIVCQILTIMSPASRRIHWHFDINALTFLLTFALPVAQCYFIMIDRGYSDVEAVRGSALFEIIFLVTLWRLGDPFAKTSSKDVFANISSIVSVEAGISRVVVVGTSILAILAGFTAVDLPFSYLSALFRPVSRSSVEAMEEKMLRAVNAVRQMRDREALHSDTQSSYLYGDDRIHKVPSSGSLQGTQKADVPMRKRVAVGARRFYDNLVYGENVPLEGDEPPNIEIEKAVRVSFLEYHESLTAWRASQFARTPLGVVVSIFGYALLIGCVVRVYMAINNIINSGSARRSNPSEQIHKVIMAVGIDADVQVVSQYITFLFTSTLLSVNIRAALRRITLVFSLVSSNSTLSSSAAIFLAQLLGAYFLSTIVIIRSLLPLGYRSMIAEALGDLEYQFYLKWFDYLFISSAAVGTVILFLQARRQSIRSTVI